MHPEEYKRPKDTKVFCQEFVWVFAPNLVTRLWSEVAYEGHPFASLGKWPTFVILPDKYESIYDFPLPEEEHLTLPILLKDYAVYDKDISKLFELVKTLDDAAVKKEADVPYGGSLCERFNTYKDRDNISYWIEVRWETKEKLRLCITITSRNKNRIIKSQS